MRSKTLDGFDAKAGHGTSHRLELVQREDKKGAKCLQQKPRLNYGQSENYVMPMTKHDLE